MKLNGKGKKTTNCVASMKRKKTNKKGYYVCDDWDGHSSDPVKYYLKTPKGKILLERTETPIV